MTLQEMFDKAVAHFAQMDRPSMSTPSEYGGSDCAYRGHEGNMCIVGAFIDDKHYESSFEGKGVLEFSTLGKATYLTKEEKKQRSTCGVQPVLSAVAASMGVEALDEDKANLLFQLQLIHDDHSDGFDIGEHNWYEVVKPYLIDLANDCDLEYANVG